MGAFPGTPYPFPTPFGLTLQGPWPPVFLAQTAPLAAAAPNLGTLTIPPMNHLYINITDTGHSGSDFASIRFNGDTGANYVSRFITAVAGQAAAFVDAPFVSATAMRLTAISGTQGQSIWLSINNFATVSKQTIITAPLFTGAAATAATIVQGGAGEWVNTTAQITSVLALIGGANNFNAGSSITIWGSN